MSKLLQEGGFPVWFVLLFGIAALAAAVAYAARPQPRRIGPLFGLSMATLFATLSSAAANLGAVFHTLAGTDSRHPEMSFQVKEGSLILMEGLGEAMSTPILGFALLSLVGLFYAVGAMRQPTP
jgi:hypothetical protein